MMKITNLRDIEITHYRRNLLHKENFAGNLEKLNNNDVLSIFNRFILIKFGLVVAFPSGGDY